MKQSSKSIRSRSDGTDHASMKSHSNWTCSIIFCFSCFVFKNRDGEQAMEENELVKPKRSQSPSEEDQSENSTVCQQVREIMYIKCAYDYISLHSIASLNALWEVKFFVVFVFLVVIFVTFAIFVCLHRIIIIIII